MAAPAHLTVLVVGLPESGKSTLVARLTDAPRVQRTWTHVEEMRRLVEAANGIVPPRRVEFNDPLLAMQKRAPALWE